MKLTKIRIGDLIQRVSVKNTQGEIPITKYMSVMISKEIIPCYAPKKVEKSDPRKFKIIRQGQFVFSGLANKQATGVCAARMYQDVGIVSSHYEIFDLIDNKVLDAEYLRLVLSSPVFDTYAINLAAGSAYLRFTWKDFCDFEFEVPSLQVQHEVVRKFQVVEELIATKRSIYQTILQAVDTLFRDQFLDLSSEGIKFKDVRDKLTIEEVCNLLSGPNPTITFSDSKNEVFKYPYLLNNASIEGLQGYVDVCNVEKPSVFVTGKGYAGVVFNRYEKYFCANGSKALTANPEVCTNEYLAYFLKYSQLPFRGTTQPYLANADFKKFVVELPDLAKMQLFSSTVAPMLAYVETLVNEILELTALRKIWLQSFNVDFLSR